MKLIAKVEHINESPYESFLLLSDSNIKGITVISVQGSTEKLNLPIKSNYIKLETYIRFVLEVEKVTYSSPSFIHQDYKKNGLKVCGEVTQVFNKDSFECFISSINLKVRVEAEKDLKIDVGDVLKFDGTLHADI